MRIALAATCLGDAMFPQAPTAVVRLLERLGHTVVVPEQQACCGQMHVNTGYRRQAVPVIRNHVRAFGPVADGEWDAVVVPSGSCTGSIRHQQSMVLDRAGLAAEARTATAVASRTYELSELLVDALEVTDVGAWFPHRVTYHPTCHSLRMLGVGDRPLRLLRAVEGIELADLPEAEGCCGFGGTFALKNADTSAAMLADKVRNVTGTGAEFLTAGDYSCLMHIGGGLSRSSRAVRTIHLAEILASTRERPWLAESAGGAPVSESSGTMRSTPAGDASKGATR
ncbi:(Fe-S)-binding protein [Myceligenerans pegani]|uniref:(Fe-S)-binding protein n=1 Tax=Myceligenerans pegani TaxID=2776917 RepID=A0ABR9N4W8_9MICO|nr:(Fe-S)-binding protein [Myceligenerans sp. TRM 65318]MBE1878717.1 (Fe-S)-binding protein [Myceligenerans sp. TRM 65318]MBE3020988.1 (Fe-S)-binding protein [Myceligenerans sp. TRM 65318]